MKKAEISEKILLVFSLILILGGTAIFSYPYISNYFAEKNQTEAIRTYEETIVNLNEENIAEEFQKAQIYNENLSGDPVHDPFVIGSGYALPENYKEVLNLTNDGIMGYVEIPKISVYLPIYHGTSDEVLTKGIGHIESTSLPIGGNSTHSVLTGHTGLPSAELFTRLDELVTQDIFYIRVLNQTLTYKIYETKVILPNEISELQITNGNDFITLVTCTPYGVNSHRLLVKAKRVEYEEYNENIDKTVETDNSNEENISKPKNYYLIGIQIGCVILVIFIVLFIIIKIIRRKKHE